MRALSIDEIETAREEVMDEKQEMAMKCRNAELADAESRRRGLSTPAEHQLAVAVTAEHQKLNAPKPQSDRPLENQFWLKPNRWNGPRGVADKDLTVSERKCIEGAERNRGHQLSFAERKELMLRFRADMARFQPAKPIRVKTLSQP